VLSGELPSQFEIPTGCCFRSRCPMAAEVCAEPVPDVPVGAGRSSRCHFATEDEIAEIGRV
jgi:oligopeptide/dipeptide ABC transporter ATP-binding protein